MIEGKPMCVLKVWEVPLHLYQIIAGFMLLKKQGIIDLKVERASYKLPYNMMEVEVNGSIKLLYDVNDGYDNLVKKEESYIEFMDSILDKYDICFKRSYSESYNQTLVNGYKINPLGLNYMTTIRGNIAHKPQKDDPKNEKIKKIIRGIPGSKYYNNKYLLEKFECKTEIKEKSQILFFARLWDPSGHEIESLSKDKLEERISINNMRVKCIKACKEEFGDSFKGGITPNNYAVENYSELVVTNKKITNRDSYLKLMQSSDICIATTGLHDSIGWKFAEYVAASKAIVSEKLHYKLPGEFNEGINYFEFNDVRQCIDSIYKLINDKDKRYEMMKANEEYYKNYVKADKLVFNSLRQCFELAKVESVV